MKTANIDTAAYQAEYTAMVEPFLDSPVIAVGIVSRRGALRDTVVGKLSTGTYWTLRARAKGKNGGLPSTVLLAVTATHVHAFGQEFKKGKTVVTGEVAQWERAGMHVDADQNRACDLITITPQGCEPFEFESMRGYDFNHALFATLLEPAA